MSGTMKFFVYLLVMAGVTYLIRTIPFVLCKNEITNPRIKAFLDYIPYAVLSAMTFPAILYATTSLISAAIGFMAAVFFSMKGKGLLLVAVFSCAVVYLTELAMSILGI